jgi:hypothetical protein
VHDLPPGPGSCGEFPGGQGGRPYWTSPAPRELLESSCGICHDPKGMAKRGARPRGRARLFEEKVPRLPPARGLGGSLGAALDSAGLRTRHQLTMANLPGETTYRWLDLHFRTRRGSSRDPS